MPLNHARESRVGNSGVWGIHWLVKAASLNEHFAVAVRSVFLQEPAVALAPPEDLAVGIAIAIGRARLAHQIDMIVGADLGGGVAEVDRDLGARFAGVVEPLPLDCRAHVVGGSGRGGLL